MNNALDIALSRVLITVPRELLTLAFTVREQYQRTYPLEQMILEKIVRGIIRKDANIYGGKEKKIVLLPEYREKMEWNKSDSYMFTGTFSLYRIPPREREGQAIVDVEGLTYRGNYSAGHAPYTAGWTGGATEIMLGATVIDSHTGYSSPPRPDVTLLSGDLVRLSPSQHGDVVWIMSCRIGYDQDFTNLNPQAIPLFTELVITATKMYCYNTLIVEVDKAFVDSGYELSSFKMILDTYADAPDRYKELMDQFAGAVQLDPDRIRPLLRYML